MVKGAPTVDSYLEIVYTLEKERILIFHHKIIGYIWFTLDGLQTVANVQFERLLNDLIPGTLDTEVRQERKTWNIFR
jgi:hypothetical protein